MLLVLFYATSLPAGLGTKVPAEGFNPFPFSVEATPNFLLLLNFVLPRLGFGNRLAGVGLEAG